MRGLIGSNVARNRAVFIGKAAKEAVSVLNRALTHQICAHLSSRRPFLRCAALTGGNWHVFRAVICNQAKPIRISSARGHEAVEQRLVLSVGVIQVEPTTCAMAFDFEIAQVN